MTAARVQEAGPSAEIAEEDEIFAERAHLHRSRADIGRDGAMAGPNVEATVDLAFQLTTPVIVSGGVSSIDDLAEVKEHEKAGIVGVICGRALYDGRIDLAQAVRLLRA